MTNLADGPESRYSGIGQLLPGGRVRAMEASADALRREMREESGDEVIVGPLQWTVEVFFRQGA